MTQLEVIAVAPIQNLGSILIVDDDADLRALVKRKFSSANFLVDEADGVSRAKKMLYDKDYDLVILDLMMIPESGYQLFEFLKSDQKFKWIPLIVLSGKDDIDDKVRCLRLGADDYITKPFNTKEIIARVDRLLTRSRDFEEMAFRDGLTGVYNRRYFENHLMIELKRVQRTDEPITIALLDIDRFKLVNDTYGHPVGDLVLRGVSRLLKEKLREFDLVARYGGEEFIIAFVKTPERTTLQIMDQVLNHIREQSLAVVGGEEIHVTFSAGITTWEKGLSMEDWIERADQLLYQAKVAGRNRCVICSS